MTIKQIFNIAVFIIIAGLAVSTSILYNNSLKDTENIEYLRHNLSVKDTKISELYFSEKELKSYIKDRDTKHKVEIDSILKVHKVKINNLISYNKINDRITLKDTTSVASNEFKVENDSTYRKELKYSKNCIKIDGYILTEDKNTEAFITNIDVNNKIYITKSYKKSFWDNIFFRKGKEVTQITSDCGESTTDGVIIK